MTTLVTGGGGFLGRALVRELVAAGRTVRSFSRGSYPELERLGVEQFRGDLADAQAVSAAIAGCDTVFHVAALAGAWGPSERYERTNVEGTRHVLEACRRAGVRELIYTSTPSVVFDGGDMEGCDESVPYAEHFEADYPRTKAIAEREVLAASGPELRTVALRPHLVWGPGDTNLLPRIVDRRRRGRLRQIGRRNKRIAPTFIDDAVSAHLAAEFRLKRADGPLEAPAGRAYFVTSGESIEVWEMIDRLLLAAGERPLDRRVSRTTAMVAARVLETIWRLTGRDDEPPLTRWVVRELTTSHWFSLEAADRDLGWSPKVSIAEGMRRLEASRPGRGNEASG